MTSMVRLLVLSCSVLALTGCDDQTSSAGGGVTPGEAQALNDAAEMLDNANAPKIAEPPKPKAQ
jgi:hypothetical protein